MTATHIWGDDVGLDNSAFSHQNTPGGGGGVFWHICQEKRGGAVRVGLPMSVRILGNTTVRQKGVELAAVRKEGWCRLVLTSDPEVCSVGERP